MHYEIVSVGDEIAGLRLVKAIMSAKDNNNSSSQRIVYNYQKENGDFLFNGWMNDASDFFAVQDGVFVAKIELKPSKWFLINIYGSAVIFKPFDYISNDFSCGYVGDEKYQFHWDERESYVIIDGQKKELILESIDPLT